jgi:hypothetical protein
MQTTDQLVQQVLGLDVQQLTTADACAEQLKIACDGANANAASASVPATAATTMATRRMRTDSGARSGVRMLPSGLMSMMTGCRSMRFHVGRAGPGFNAGAAAWRGA